MILFWVFGALGALVAALPLAALAHTLLLRPTPTARAAFPPVDQARAAGYAQALRRLIQCETVSFAGQTDRGKFTPFHALLKEQFPLLHQQASVTELDGSLLFKLASPAPRAKPLLLMSHQDVVAAEGEWRHGPFSGEIAESAVWGRGAVDTKGNLFCFMQAIEELLQTGWQPEYDLYIASSCTEEWAGDGAPATAALLQKQGVRFGLVLDEGGMILDPPMAGVIGPCGMVGVAEKGWAELEVIARETKDQKASPLLRLSGFVCRLERHSPFKARFSPTLRETFRRLAPNMQFGMRFLLGNLWLFEPLLTLLLPKAVPMVGSMMNTSCTLLPGRAPGTLGLEAKEAYLTVRLRCMPHQPASQCVPLVCELARRYGLETRLLYQATPPPEVSCEDPAFRLLEEIAQAVYPGYALSPYFMAGGTDSRFYVDLADTILRFAPMQIDPQQFASVHHANENLAVRTLPPAVDFFKALLTRWPASVPAKQASFL